jgi:aryl-alcohol dehydrogenase-like predicted oxidoreductase
MSFYDTQLQENIAALDVKLSPEQLKTRNEAGA